MTTTLVPRREDQLVHLIGRTAVLDLLDRIGAAFAACTALPQLREAVSNNNNNNMPLFAANTAPEPLSGARSPPVHTLSLIHI